MAVDEEALVRLDRPLELLLDGRARAAVLDSLRRVEDLVVAFAIGVRELDRLRVEHLVFRFAVLLELGDAARLQILELQLHEGAAVVAKDNPVDHPAGAALDPENTRLYSSHLPKSSNLFCLYKQQVVNSKGDLQDRIA